MKIGIPKALIYFHEYGLWEDFFSNLGLEIITSSTNKDIVKRGINNSNDEMCLSLKIYLGHIDYLKDKCDYIFMPVLKNEDKKNQLCAFYLSLYDIVNNIFDIKILNDSYLKIGQKMGFKNKQIKLAYKKAFIRFNKTIKKDIINNTNKLNSTKKKILLFAHSYNSHDNYVSKEIINNLYDLNCEIIYSDYFYKEESKKLSSKISENLYWKYSKENMGSIIMSQNKIDGFIFLSSFPCGIDSLVNELITYKIKKPYLNLIIDDIDSLGGIMTRIESFVDIIEAS